jgi:hypothetical protein
MWKTNSLGVMPTASKLGQPSRGDNISGLKPHPHKYFASLRRYRALMVDLLIQFLTYYCQSASSKTELAALYLTTLISKGGISFKSQISTSAIST